MSQTRKMQGASEGRSLIYYRDRLFQYPFSLTNALKHLGPIDTALTGLSYLATWLNEQADNSSGNGLGNGLGNGAENGWDDGFESAESWLIKRFGTHLYQIFWASYFHKRWGQCAGQLQAECAIAMAHEISKDGSLIGGSLIGGSLMRSHINATVEKTEVEKIEHTDQRLERIVLCKGKKGEASEDVLLSAGDQVVSSLSLARLVPKLWPPAPANVIAAAEGLRYRSLVTVVLILDQSSLFSEHEIHVHSPNVAVSHIQNLRDQHLKDQHLETAAKDQKTYLGMTYWYERGDRLCAMSENDLIQLARHELISLKLVSEDSTLIEPGAVIRQANVEPVRTRRYYQHKAVVQTYLERFKNLKIVDQHSFNDGSDLRAQPDREHSQIG